MARSGADQKFDLEGMLAKSRIIFLDSEINHISANWIIAALLALEEVDPEKEIKMYIHSPGGDVTAGLAIYDTMQLLLPEISTYCVGMAASFATILLAAGAKGKRFALPNATIHLHQSMGGVSGQAADIAIGAQRILQLQKTIYEILGKHTGQTIEKLARDCDRDFFLTPEQAKEYGIIDNIITREQRLRRI